MLSERTTVTLGNISRDLGDVIAGRNSKLQNSIAQAESAAQTAQKTNEMRVKNLEGRLNQLMKDLDDLKVSSYKYRLERLEEEVSKLNGIIHHPNNPWG